MRKFLLAAAAAAIIPTLHVVPLRAEGPRLEPGKWEFTTTSDVPMRKEPKVTTTTKCITKEDAEKDPLAEMVEEGKCTVLSREIDGDAIDFEIECEGSMGMSSRGKGHFQADGTTASGTMEMSMKMPGFGGSGMKMTQKWEGKRIGDCD
jgi:hypothetical protein